MLYTRKGDDGKTKAFGCDQRFSKSSAIAEALGSLDEINSFLGLCKVKSANSKIKLGKRGLGLSEVVGNFQNDLFIIQAEIAGADKKISSGKIDFLEEVIGEIERELPPIKTFFVSGGTELAASFDFARTLARRAERRVVEVAEEGKVKVEKETLAYLNRLSSMLYALARLMNHKSGINEEPPSYK